MVLDKTKIGIQILNLNRAGLPSKLNRFKASPSIWPAVPSLQRGLSINPGVTTWCNVGAVEDMMCVMWACDTKGT